MTKNGTASASSVKREAIKTRAASSSRLPSTSSRVQGSHVSSPLPHSSSPYSLPLRSQQLPLLSSPINTGMTTSSLKQPPFLDIASSPLRDHNFSMTGAGPHHHPGVSLHENQSRKFMYSPPSPVGQVSPGGTCSCSCRGEDRSLRKGLRELLVSLALMTLLSMMMALLALVFLNRTTPTVSVASNDDNAKILRTSASGVSSSRVTPINAKEFVRVSNFSVTLTTVTLSLNLICLFVSTIQFLSAIKLLKAPGGTKRTHDFLKKTSHVRIIAIGAFLISIPIFFTGVILFTFINFDEMPALVTSVVIGIAIVFCGITAVQNVYLWQQEKTRASKERLTLNLSRISHPLLLNNSLGNMTSNSKPNQTQSAYFPMLELSTLV